MAIEMYGNPLLIRDGLAPMSLERVPISGKDYNEAFVQRLAFEYPSCLPVSEIDRAYEGLVPICMELSCPSGYIDAFYVTPKGRLVIAEAKLWRNPEARRKVVAQILDYAKDLSRWSYADLQREVSRNLGRKGNVLYEMVKERYPDVQEAEFVDEVQKSLRRGRFLLVILGDGIREGAAAIAEFLESSGSLEFTFGLVELSIYKADGLGQFVQPRVLARTAIIERRIVQLEAGMQFAADASDLAASVDADEELSPDRQFYYDFWTEFLGNLRLDDPDQPISKTSKMTNAYFDLPPSVGTTWISAFFSKYRERVGVYLTWSKGSFADAAYDLLLQEKEEIEKEIGCELEWSSRAGKHQIIIRKPYDDVWADKNRADIQAFFADNVNKFVNAFRGRMKRISDELDK